MINFVKRVIAVFTLLAVVLLFSCCGTEANNSLDKESISDELVFEGMEDLQHAEKFDICYYQGGYALLTIASKDYYLIVPEGKAVPSDLPKEVMVLQRPIDNIYMVASAAMDMFAEIDAIDAIKFSALDIKDWYIEEAIEAMEAGEMIFAGKYSAPNYELLIDGECNLAFENLMISHSPEIREQLEGFGIPVIVDNSSDELTPLGRMEWVKVAGVLTDKMENARQAFSEQEDIINQVMSREKTDYTVAFFYINSNGAVNVRKPSDYLPKMIKLAGGNYIFESLEDDVKSKSSTTTLQMEYFYENAHDADFLIYNSAVNGTLRNMEDFLDKSSLLKDFKAVKEGRVYCTGENLYQSSMDLGIMIRDINHMLNGEDEDMKYIYKLE